ncbi:unnamed protein product, partial [marine sediment metagenome]
IEIVKEESDRRPNRGDRQTSSVFAGDGYGARSLYRI